MQNLQTLSNILSIKYPIILAPMFLVTNAKMVDAAISAGATGTLPAHNYRTSSQLRKDILRLKNNNRRPFGVNIIHDFKNELTSEFLQICIEEQVDFIISSLGDPSKIVDKCKPVGIKVFADVVNMDHAQKAVNAGVNALIAVSNLAGGHAGQLNNDEFIPQLTEKFSIPIISAGGIATKHQFDTVMGYGAAGILVGTPFIATKECDVSDEYKQGIISASKSDIILTRRISGIPITVINTNYIKSLGMKPSWVELQLRKRKKIKRIITKIMKNSLFKKFQHKIIGPDYSKVFCAGPIVNDINKLSTVEKVIKRITNE